MLAGVDVRLDRALLGSDLTEVGGLLRLVVGLDGVSKDFGESPLFVLLADLLPIIMVNALGAAAASMFSVFSPRGLCRTGSERAALCKLEAFLPDLAARLLDLDDWRVDLPEGKALLI